MATDEQTPDRELTLEELAPGHLPEQTMYKVQSPQADGAAPDSVTRPQTTRTNEFRLLSFELDPDGGIDWHAHVPGLGEVTLRLSGRARYTLERADGSHQVLEVGPMAVAYVSGGARHKIETVGEEPHRSLSVAKFDPVARLEALEDTAGRDESNESEDDSAEWQDALFVDRKRDEVVAKNEDLVSE